MIYRKLGTTKDQCILVRVMPGDPTSPNLMQRNPYVIQRNNKKYYTPDGWIEEVGAETHIPLEKFEFKEW